MIDKVDPLHYKGNRNFEVIDINEAFDLNFSRGNVVKYVCRAGLKDEHGYSPVQKELEDLRKAKWYLDREIERVEKIG